jgi:hypothetical protein
MEEFQEKRREWEFSLQDQLFFFPIIIYITLATFHNALKCIINLLKSKIIPNVALENMTAEKKYF